MFEGKGEKKKKGETGNVRQELEKLEMGVPNDELGVKSFTPTCLLERRPM